MGKPSIKLIRREQKIRKKAKKLKLKSLEERKQNEIINASLTKPSRSIIINESFRFSLTYFIGENSPLYESTGYYGFTSPEFLHSIKTKGIVYGHKIFRGASELGSRFPWIYPWTPIKINEKEPKSIQFKMNQVLKSIAKIVEEKIQALTEEKGETENPKNEYGVRIQVVDNSFLVTGRSHYSTFNGISYISSDYFVKTYDPVVSEEKPPEFKYQDLNPRDYRNGKSRRSKIRNRTR